MPRLRNTKVEIMNLLLIIALLGQVKQDDCLMRRLEYIASIEKIYHDIDREPPERIYFIRVCDPKTGVCTDKDIRTLKDENPSKTQGKTQQARPKGSEGGSRPDNSGRGQSRIQRSLYYLRDLSRSYYRRLSSPDQIPSSSREEIGESKGKTVQGRGPSEQSVPSIKELVK